MGLDATAYGRLTLVENPVLDEDGYPEGGSQRSFWENPDFPGRMAGIEGRPAVYEYEVTADFFHGGYGRYNGVRELLAKLAGYPAIEVEQYGQKYQRHDEGAFRAGAGPFYEMICFSDCEGTIGPVACAKLAADFAAHQTEADAHENEYFRSCYAMWRAGFELAADGGAVHFH